MALRNQTAIVTGASSGIGRVTALALAERGVYVALASRNAAALNDLAREVESLGSCALVMPTDVTCKEQVDSLVQETLARWGKVDILVANAGEYVRSPVREITIAMLERSMAVNFYGQVHAALAVLPGMLARKSGHIFLMTSMDAKTGIPPDAPYAAAKYATSGFGGVLRQELHGSGVAVTIVYPGRIDTPMIAGLNFPWISPKLPPEAVARAIVRALRRRPAEIILPFQAVLLHYLNVFSPKLADWITRSYRLQGWSPEEK